MTNSSALRDQEMRDTLERRVPLEALSSSTSPQEVSSPLVLPTSVESKPKTVTEPILASSSTIQVEGEEEEDEGPLPEAIQNLHAGRIRKPTSNSHSRSTSLNLNGTPLSPLRTSYATLQNSNHSNSPSSPSATGGGGGSTSSSPILNRSNLPRSPFLYHQDSNHHHHHHHVARSPSSSSSNISYHSPRDSLVLQQGQSQSQMNNSSKTGLPPKPENKEEQLIWNIADDFTQGAPLFEPLRKLIESGINLLG